METFFEPYGSNRPRWLQHSMARLQRAWNDLQRLLSADRQPEALALIPIRAVQSHATRQRSRRTWRD